MHTQQVHHSSVLPAISHARTCCSHLSWSCSQARLNAKIDSKAGTVVMGTQTQSIQDQLIEKAKGLSVRTFVLANAVVGGGARS
jgi:hypothetical protein